MADKPSDVILEHQASPGAPRPAVEETSNASRLFQLIQPMLLAVLVDGADLTDLFIPAWAVTVPAAAIFTWFITGSFKLPNISRAVISVMAAIYLMLPGTEMIPLATVLTAVAGLTQRMKK